MTCGERDQFLSLCHEHCARSHQQRVGSVLNEGREARVDIVRAAGFDDDDLPPNRASSGRQLGNAGRGPCSHNLRIEQHTDDGRFGQQLCQQPKLFGHYIAQQAAHACEVPPWPIETCDEA